MVLISSPRRTPRSDCVRFFFLPRYRERDTTGQLIGPIDEVLAVVADLVQGSIDWAEACKKLPAYDGVQAVE